MLTFKQYLIEARHARQKDMSWMHDAYIVADGNIRRARETYNDGLTRRAEIKLWENYKKWIKDNQPVLQKWYDQMKADRDTFIEHSKDLLKGRETAGKVWRDANRMRQAEVWSGNIDQHDYPVYWELIDDDDNPDHHDFTILMSNTMIDILGGLRDEKY